MGERPTFLFVTPLFGMHRPEVAAVLEATGRGGPGPGPTLTTEKDAGEAIAPWALAWHHLPLHSHLGSAAPAQCPGPKWKRGSTVSLLKLPAGGRKGSLPTEAHGHCLPMVFLCLVSRMRVPETGQACHLGHC